MGAEIVWSTVKSGPVRFGRLFQSSAERDPYSGCGTVEDHGTFCVIGPLAGQMDAQDHDDILECCAGWGFKQAKVERRGKTYVYDLTVKPYRRVRA